MTTERKHSQYTVWGGYINGPTRLQKSGFIAGGQTGFGAGAGFWLDLLPATGAGRLSLGNSQQWLKWDGQNLQMAGASASFRGALGVGTEKSARGTVKVFGDGAGSACGGSLQLCPAEDHRAGLEAWTLDVYQQNLRIYTGGDPGGWAPHQFHSDGRVYFARNVSVESLTDRTPWPQNKAEAWAAVCSLKSCRAPEGEAGPAQGLDHQALHPSLRCGEGEAAGRNLSMTVSALAWAVQDLGERVAALEARLEELPAGRECCAPGSLCKITASPLRGERNLRLEGDEQDGIKRE